MAAPNIQEKMKWVKQGLTTLPNTLAQVIISEYLLRFLKISPDQFDPKNIPDSPQDNSNLELLFSWRVKEKRIKPSGVWEILPRIQKLKDHVFRTSRESPCLS